MSSLRSFKRKSKKQKLVVRSFDRLKENVAAFAKEGIDNTFIPQRVVKMSEVLKEFAAPYGKWVNSREDYEKMLTLAVIAWNLACTPEGERELLLSKAIKEASIASDPEFRLVLNELIARKLENFGHIRKWIAHFHVTEIPQGYHLEVASTAMN
jgi:hypothetical protein